MPGIGSFTGVVNRTEGYGLQMKQAIRDDYGTSIGLSGRGEMIPNEQSYLRDRSGGEGSLGHPGPALPLGVERSRAEPGPPHAGDLPRDPRIDGRADRHRRRGGGGAAAATTGTGPQRGQQAPQTGQAGPQTGQPNAPAGQPTSGGRVSARPAPPPIATRPPISRGGAIIHEVGTVRMGDDPQTSPLNKFCQAHEVKNLFVADAAPFVSNADKNPTHTIIALAWRTAEYLAEEMRKGNV